MTNLLRFALGFSSFGGVVGVLTRPFLEPASEPPKPTPVVLVADGRSGSYITMAVLARLTGSCPPPDPGMEVVVALEQTVCWLEIFGGHATTALEVEDPLARMSDFLSSVARVHANSTLVGFQWKTFKSQYLKTRTPEYESALQYLGEHDVLALHLTRNPLDEFLSESKHRAHKDLPPHCDADDQACLQSMLSPYSVDVEQLIRFLNGYEKAQHAVHTDLKHSNLRYMNVTYEVLIDNDDDAKQLSAWQNVLNFLGVDSSVDKQKLDEAFMSQAKTHVDQQGSNVKNWDDVVHALHTRDGGRHASHMAETLLAHARTATSVKNWKEVASALLKREGGRHAHLLTEKILRQMQGRAGILHGLH